MGGRFSSKCAATYVFVLRPNDTGSNNGGADQRSDISRKVRSIAGGGEDHVFNSKHFDPEEATHVLHQCMRDVEAFVAHVQAALQESCCSGPPGSTKRAFHQKKNKVKKKKNRKRKNSSSSLSSSPPEVIRYMPTELDMTGIFKRIKLVINYIARLKYDLYEPNAPELIHVTFAHLKTLVSVCLNCPSLYPPSLPSRVVLPLLSRDAVRFLHLSLVSNEIDVWKSLGSAWTTPRDEWKGDDSLCNAMLLEGWEACYPPNGTVVHNRPYSRTRHRSNGGNTDTETFLSEDTRSLSTPRSRFS